ncbi:uncharacterized protein [Aristolochia californica]|uniref:uncharacterized protein n=1 Tax=Aristolochia californica TaxID=171875 RepID=UPI0035DD7C61
MGSEGAQLHIFFFPFVGQGHLLPMMDMAKLIAVHGVRASLILTPLGASILEKTINRAKAAGYSMDLHLIQYPPDADLPGGDENPNRINSPDSKGKFFRALRTLEKPFQKIVEEHRPDVVVSDIFFPWTVDVATKFGIPRLSFNGSSFFSLCVFDALRRYSPHVKVEREEEAFVLPGLPDPIELTRAQIPAALKTQSNVSDLWAHIHEAEAKSYGVVVNSFCELEQNYVEHVVKTIGRKAWHVGPVFLCDGDPSEIADRGREAPTDALGCLNWLDTQKPDSVLYICFGSLCQFSPPQLRETAMALESSDCSFIWVLKNEEKLPEGFEERRKDKGFIIRGWAPQIQILNHPAVGGFVTHCGWNSILEGVTAGLPMITWPVFAEQFFNEKLITKTLKIGVGVGAGSCSSLDDANNMPIIKREVIEEAVRGTVSDTEEAKRMRAKAREYRVMGKRAVKKGGSSYTDLNRLIDELKMVSLQKRLKLLATNLPSVAVFIYSESEMSLQKLAFVFFGNYKLPIFLLLLYLIYSESEMSLSVELSVEKIDNTAMAEEVQTLHIFFFPFMAQGHMIPMIDTAKLFAARGVRATVVLSPHNASVFEKTINRARSTGGLNIQLLVLEFPSDFGLPKEIQNLDQIYSEDQSSKFLRASAKLETPFRRLVEEHRPHCIVSDSFFPWTADVTRSFGVPRLVFNGSSFFSQSIDDSLMRQQPHADAASDAFVVPGLPDRIELTRSQLPECVKTRNEFSELFERAYEADMTSQGVVMNSFYELEAAYVDHFRNKMGREAWHIGPVCFCNKDTLDMTDRGLKSSVNGDDCWNWLDAQKLSSVLYLCFGSLCYFSPSQLLEIATALESSDCSFIWVLKEGATLPDDFLERTRGKGLIIRGWAPQMLILNHPAVGGFVTHCGWNSILEGVSAGVPMITWPIFAEQFYNEKLVTKVLKVGVGVGNESWVSWDVENKNVIGREMIDKAIRCVIGEGEEARRMKGKARELQELGKRAVEVGGSSYADLSRLLQELESICGLGTTMK